MSFARYCRVFSFGAGLLGLAILPGIASAQQITYYDFDVPQSTPSETSYQCTSGNPGSLLFCFNDGTGLNASPSYLSDTYPAIIDPVATDNPAQQSTHFAVQTTPAAGAQNSSLWFSVPQKVSNGFTAYFTFKFTPNSNSYATADGIAFVIQNSTGGGTNGPCAETGSGPTVVGADGGCIGYGGIDNSLAIEFDTYFNSWDPQDIPGTSNDNHVAIQNCGAGLPNSPDHTGSCLVNLNAASSPLPAIISNPEGITMADGYVHQVVVNYSGPTESSPNLLQVYLDPPFNPGTQTPSSLAVPILSGTYNLAANLNLMNSATGNTPSYDSAYVGFTSATGAAFEQQELMNWTYTPHTPVTQQQPIAPNGNPTVFPFGAHVYATTYPPDVPTSGISQVVTANTVTPQFFSQLIANTPFAGSKCQVYDGTGGNCIIYSVSCVTTGTTTFVPCPPSDQNVPITIKSAYNDSTPAVSPGYLQGDPFYSGVSTITGDGTKATVDCVGECSVTTGQTVTIGNSQVGSSPSGFNGTITVLNADPSVPNVFTFSSGVSGTATGGYLTSNNLQNVFYSYSPLRIDATTTGKVHTFSDFVVTSLTSAPTALNVQTPTGVVYGQSAPVTVTASSGSGVPTGNVLLSVDGGTAMSQPLVAGATSSSATFTLTGLTAGPHSLSISYPSTGSFLGNTATANLTIGQAQPTVTVGIVGSRGGSVFIQYGVDAVAQASISPATSSPGTLSGSGACSFGPQSITSGEANDLIYLNGVGLCTVTASWSADANNLAATGSATINVPKNYGSQFAIAASATSTSGVANPISTPVGSPITASAIFNNISGTNPSLMPQGGTITVSTNVAGDPTCTFLIGGNCPLTFATPGPRTLLGQYSGSADFLPSSSIPPFTTVTVIGPVGSVSPSSLNFGTVDAGGIGIQTVTLTNTGNAPLTVSVPFLFDVGNGNSKEFVALSLCPKTLAVGNSCSIIVNFLAGPSIGTQTAILKIADNAPGSPQQVPLTANVINPQASFSPSSVSFGTVKLGTPVTTSVSLTNPGTSPLTISGITVKGANPGDFAETNNCPATLAAKASCGLSVTFTPAKTGARSAYISVGDNTLLGVNLLPLSGTGK